MNKDFAIVHITRKNEKTGSDDAVVLVTYKGEALALFKGDDLESRAIDYIKTYGYLAEWRRLWLIGTNPNWDECLRVNIDG
jgi:hypothetical protein